MTQVTTPNINHDSSNGQTNPVSAGNHTPTNQLHSPSISDVVASFAREETSLESGQSSWTLGLQTPAYTQRIDAISLPSVLDVGFNYRLDAQQRNLSAHTTQTSDYLKAKISEPLLFDKGHNEFIQSLEALGVKECTGRVSFLPGRQYGEIGVLRDQDSQMFRFNRDGTGSYTIYSSDYLSEVVSWLSNGQVTLSSATIVYDGRQIKLSPALTHTTPLGFTATVASGFDQIQSQTYGLTPEYNHLFSKQSGVNGSGIDSMNGALSINTYKLSNIPGGLISTVDLSLSDYSSLSLILGNDGAKNLVAVRGLTMLELFDKPAKFQLDGLYVNERRDGFTSELLAGAATLGRDTPENSISIKMSGFGIKNETGVGRDWSAGASITLELRRGALR